MATEQVTESEKLALQISEQFRKTGEFAKAYSAKGILDLVYAAARDFAPKAVVGLKLEIVFPNASLSGSITLPDPDVTIKIGSLVYTNDPESKIARLKLAKPAEITDEIREKDLLKVGTYKVLKALVFEALNDPNKLLALGFQRMLDETKTDMKVTGIASRVQTNQAIGVKITGEPKK